jgi:hypothetical protein
MDNFSLTQHGHRIIEVPGIDSSPDICCNLMFMHGFFREGDLYGGDDEVNSLICHESFAKHATLSRRTYQLVLIPTKVVSEDITRKKKRTVDALRAYVEATYPGALSLTAFSATLLLSLRITVSDAMMKNDLKTGYIVLLHNPIPNTNDFPKVLGISWGFDGDRLFACSARPHDELDQEGMIAVVIK